MSKFVDREVLLQVKRIYSQDEIIADLNRQLKEAKFNIGILESQVSELQDENKLLCKNLECNQEYVIHLKTTIQQILKAKHKYKKDAERFMYKNAELVFQLNKQNNNELN